MRKVLLIIGELKIYILSFFRLNEYIFVENIYYVSYFRSNNIYL